jgi:hypothetical protein
MRRVKCGLMVAVLVSCLAWAGAAAADPLPVLGTTTTTVCRFDPTTWTDPGTTTCNSESVTIEGGICSSTGLRHYYEYDIYSVRVYQGMAIARDTNGVTINGYESLRPGARLISDSGPHALTSSFYVSDPSCA